MLCDLNYCPIWGHCRNQDNADACLTYKVNQPKHVRTMKARAAVALSEARKKDREQPLYADWREPYVAKARNAAMELPGWLGVEFMKSRTEAAKCCKETI